MSPYIALRSLLIQFGLGIQYLNNEVNMQILTLMIISMLLDYADYCVAFHLNLNNKQKMKNDHVRAKVRKYFVLFL